MEAPILLGSEDALSGPCFMGRLSSFVACLRAVAHGRLWMDDSMLRTRQPDQIGQLTQREEQVRELAQQGLTNKQIGLELRIKTGTVKIHMKHIFEKTGIRGRHSLALSRMLGRLPVSLSRVSTRLAARGERAAFRPSLHQDYASVVRVY